MTDGQNNMLTEASVIASLRRDNVRMICSTVAFVAILICFTILIKA